jgi:hypothetical protein
VVIYTGGSWNAGFQQVIFGLLNKAPTLAIYIRAKLKNNNTA